MINFCELRGLLGLYGPEIYHAARVGEMPRRRVMHKRAASRSAKSREQLHSRVASAKNPAIDF